jgi:glycosyltransferase involved in cell wall biosynthesis
MAIVHKQKSKKLSSLRITIVTPHFNQLDWLGLCVASVADQIAECGPGIEHIIQDAGTPGIEEFARSHGAEYHCETPSSSIRGSRPTDANCTYRLAVYSAPDSGMYDAINRGFLRATGEILAWLNADEQYLPGTLTKVAAAFQSNPSMEMFFGDTVVTDSSGRYICSRTALKPKRLHSLISGNISFLSASNFIHKSVIENGHLLPDGWRTIGDAVWTVDLISAKVRMRRLPFYLSVFVDTGKNLSLGKNALLEKNQLASSAPRWAITAKSLIIAIFRFRKLFAGAYCLKPFMYQVFTLQNPHRRSNFYVKKPTQRWIGR